MKPTQECDPSRLSRFLNQTLGDAELVSFEEHLTSCETCRRGLADQTAAPDVWENASLYLQDSEAELHPLSSLSTGDGFQANHFSIDRVLETLAPTDDPKMLGRLDGYEISGVVGHGGMGAVLKGHDTALNRVVAIKVMAPHLASSGAARMRFAREAQAAAAITHDNVIDIYGVSEFAGLPYLVMPYARGTSLQKRIDDRGPLPVIEILRIASQIASGLSAAHEQGLVHRDIKPANILLRDGIERLVITDFGLARAVDDATVTRTGMIAGTPQYMSPEQAAGEAIDHRSDLFSLGSVIYTLCTGRVPFRAESALGILRRITDNDARSIREINPEIPEWLCKVICKLHQKDASQRYQTADEVANLLQQCLAHLQTLRSPLPEDLTAETPTLNRALACGVVGMAAVILFAFAIRFITDNGNNEALPSAKIDATVENSLLNQPQKTRGGELVPAISRAAENTPDLDWQEKFDPSIDEIQLNAWRLSEETLSPFDTPKLSRSQTNLTASEE